jgi:pimeloyl-[acyl-carrier protein] methyl ester esterase
MPYSGPIWYNEQGSGHPVLFVHGWCMSSAVWELQQAAVAAEYRFIALDLRGHGRSLFSGGHPGGFSGYAEDIVNLAEQLNLHDLVVVGWSLGVQALLKAYPRMRARINALVLVGGTPRFSSASHFPHGLAPHEAQGMRIKVRRNLERALEGFQRKLFVTGELDDPATARQVALVLAQIVPPSSATALEGLEALMEEEVLEEAALVSCPTLLLHGEHDRICLPGASRWLEQAIPGSRRSIFNGCGHAPFLSCSQRFNHELIAFIRELS